MRAPAGDGRRHRVARTFAVQVARVQAHVQLREMEAEQAHHPLDAGDAAVRDPAGAVRSEALPDHTQIVEQRLRPRVEVVVETPPHEGELPPIGLELVPRSDLGRVRGQLRLVTADRRLELVGHAGQRPGRRQLDRQLTDLVAVPPERKLPSFRERLGDRCRAGRRVPVQIAPNPGAEREREGPRPDARFPLVDQIGRGRDQAVLEEPEAAPDLVADAQAVVPHLVGLPEQRHLLGDLRLDLGAFARREPRVLEPRERPRDADVREQYRPTRCLGWVRGQDEPERGAGGTRRELVGRDVRERLERAVERFARDDAAVGILAPAA